METKDGREILNILGYFYRQVSATYISLDHTYAPLVSTSLWLYIRFTQVPYNCMDEQRCKKKILIYQAIPTRYSSHSLLVKTGRHNNIPYEARICNYCNLGAVEVEIHVLLECPYYSVWRSKYLPLNL